MIVRVKRSRRELIITLIIALKILNSECYEKNLRKIVRDQSKMVQRPYHYHLSFTNDSRPMQQHFVYPGFTQMKSIIHKMQRPKMSTILASLDTGRSKSTYSGMNIAKKSGIHPFELRLTRNTFSNTSNLPRNKDGHLIFPDLNTLEHFNYNNSNPVDTYENHIGSVPTSNFFPLVQNNPSRTTAPEASVSVFPLVTSSTTDVTEDSGLLIKSIYNSSTNKTANDFEVPKQKYTIVDFDPQEEKADFLIEERPIETLVSSHNYNTSMSTAPFICTHNYEAKADIDAQEKFSEFNIEPVWMKTKQFWNNIYESRYESLMRNPNWPPLKVILVPRSDVHSIWKKPFEKLHKNSVRFIISNIVKKLQFYPNLTFTWNEVSHLSQWWKSARQKSRTALRKLVKEGRLEITTGAWVETDEATSHLFGIVHQLMEGHQWLQYNLNYSPDVAWLTNSVTHSPTLPYLLSASGITSLVVTNLHFAWQQYLTEYQETNFMWIQNWDTDKTTQTTLNEALKKIGNDRFQKHSVLTHYLPFNSAGVRASCPQGDICSEEFNFVNSDNHLDINSFNVKERSEKILEQYSKTGTTSSHNVVLAPIGSSFSYELQSEFDLQYNNYQKISEFVNANQDIYKATIDFGTPKNYFESLFSSPTSYPTLKGDFLNFADISDGSPAYWTGFFTTRPQFKILLRRLQATLRSSEILFTFAMSYNVLKKNDVSTLFGRLVNARETVARLQDRNVVGGTLKAVALRYAHREIVKTAQDCWYIQEVAASLLSSKPDQNTTYLKKYVYREGEFISSFKSVTSGDQIYIFNSLSHERTEIVELVSRYSGIRILDHNKKDVSLQIKPTFKYGFQNVVKISKHFFRIIFVAVIPPFSFQLFKIKDTFDTTQSLSTLYCTACVAEEDDVTPLSPFTLHPVETGDVQLENYKYRLIFDEYTGFFKTVTDKSTNIEKQISIEFGAFRSSHINSGMFLFNTNVSKPLEDILSSYKRNNGSKVVMIISGFITTEFILFYGKFLYHSVTIYNLVHSPLSSAIRVETKIDYDLSPKHRELEVFMSIQTDINNGNPPEIVIDNNGFQYTARTINMSRRVESNMYPMTSMAFIQDHKNRLTIITDHAQGVTAFQEGQLIIMMDRRILFDDGRGSNEGLADNTAAWQTHYILLETFTAPYTSYQKEELKMSLMLPSFSAIYLANILNFLIDIYFIDNNRTHSCQFAFLPLVKISFPCDVTVLNYRAILNRGTPDYYIPNIALLTLHKQSFSCLIEHNSFIDCNGDSSFILQQILRNAKAVYQTNLVGTSEGVPISILNKANFPPMEISTFRIHF
nr:alpha-mannosidase 2-like [Danaus plexippus plexippus]